MKRRDFLALLGCTPLALALRRARADVALEGPEHDPRNPTLADAHAAAGRRGVPLFVIVIPATDQMWQRGTAWGELLNHGRDEELAPLARAEVACATMAQLRKYGVEGDGDEPLAVLVPTDGKQATLLRGELPALPGRVRLANGKPDDEVIADRMAVLSGLIRSALGTATSNARTLAAAVKQRVVTRPPAGSHWANGGGCGTRVEETPEEIAAKALAAERKRRARAAALARGEMLTFESEHIVGVGCGMGHVPQKSSRFLSFYTDKA